MSLVGPFRANTTADLYKPTSPAPPAAPDVAAVPVYHSPAWAESHMVQTTTATSARFTDIVLMPPSTVIADGYQGGGAAGETWNTSGYYVWIPDQNGQRYQAIYAELVRSPAGSNYQRVYLQRQPLAPPPPPPPPGVASWSEVSGQRANSGASSLYLTNLILQYPNPTTTGNLLVLTVGVNNTGALSVTDNQGNTWTRACTVNDGTQKLEIWYARNITGGAAHTVTVASSADAQLGGVIDEFQAANPSANGTLDKTSTGSGSSTTPSSGSVTTATNNQLYVGGLFNFGATNGGAMAEASWTKEFGGNYVGMESLGDASTPAAGTYSATWTLSNSVAWLAAVATFKP